MKKTLIGLFILFDTLVVAVIVFIVTRPDTIRVERSASIQASPADIFPFVNDFGHWVKWNPWQNLDPNQKVEVSTPTAGQGAWLTWKGNDDVGSGKMTITASVENERVEEDLAFMEPFESTADVAFALTPDGTGTKVTWTMDSHQTFMSKAFMAFMDMDAMVGADFERGLGNLKKEAEAVAVARVAAEQAAAEQAAAEAVPETGAGAVPAGVPTPDAAAPGAEPSPQPE